MAVSTVTLGASNSLSNEIVVTAAHRLQQSLPIFVAAFHAENLTTLVSSVAPPPVSAIVFSLAVLAATLLPSISVMLRLPLLVSTLCLILRNIGSVIFKLGTRNVHQ